MRRRPYLRLLPIYFNAIGILFLANAARAEEGLPETISYYEHVRPIFQAKCHGCHQPARSRGEYIMTDVAQLIQGGEGGEAVVVAHEPPESYLLDMVTVQPGDDRPEMPEDDEPLTPYEVALVTAWICLLYTSPSPRD